MINIMCFGDSNTYGYNPVNGTRFPDSVRWTGRLKKLLGKDFHIVEEGCNGRTSVFEDPAEPWKCAKNNILAFLNSHKPLHLTIIMLGSNDMKNIFHAQAQDIADGLEELIVMTKDFLGQKQKAKPQILLIAPPILGEEIGDSAFAHSFTSDRVAVSKELGDLYHAVAIRQGCYYLNAARVIKSSKEDCLHWMPEEHEKLAAVLATMLREEIFPA